MAPCLTIVCHCPLTSLLEHQQQSFKIPTPSCTCYFQNLNIGLANPAFCIWSSFTGFSALQLLHPLWYLQVWTNLQIWSSPKGPNLWVTGIITNWHPCWCSLSKWLITHSTYPFIFFWSSTRGLKYSKPIGWASFRSIRLHSVWLSSYEDNGIFQLASSRDKTRNGNQQPCHWNTWHKLVKATPTQICFFAFHNWMMFFHPLEHSPVIQFIIEGYSLSQQAFINSFCIYSWRLVFAVNFCTLWFSNSLVPFCLSLLAFFLLASSLSCPSQPLGFHQPYLCSDNWAVFLLPPCYTFITFPNSIANDRFREDDLNAPFWHFWEQNFKFSSGHFQS